MRGARGNLVLCIALMGVVALLSTLSSHGLLLHRGVLHRHADGECLWRIKILPDPDGPPFWFRGCWRTQGEYTACKTNLRNIATALEMYATDNNGTFPPTLDRIAPAYLKVLPVCSHHGEDTYSTAFQSTTSAYTILCAGAWHRAQGSSPNYPQYTSDTGLLEHWH